MITVACVLKVGGLYTADHVRVLESMVSRNLDGIDRFVCLSDAPFILPFVERIPLAHRWLGGWSKLELFRPKIFDDQERVLYFDIASVITGNLSSLAARKETFVTLWRQMEKPRVRLSSKVMLFTAGNMADIYSTFARTPAKMAEVAKSPDAVIDRYAMRPAYWEDVLPGQVLSYEAHCLQGLPADARVVTFDQQRPWDLIEQDWIREHYTEIGRA